jgi:hypothetical protein
MFDQARSGRSRWRGQPTASVILLSLILVSDVSAADPGTRERVFLRSLEVFDSAKSPDDYRESAKILESILADGFRNGAVYYNLGNAYFRAGEFGRAILNYRKAKPYRPRDPYLSANLQQALAAAPGRLAEPPRPWWAHVLFWTEWLSFPTKVQSCFFGCSFAAAATVLAVSLRQPRLHLLTAGLLLISLGIGSDIILSQTEVTGSRRAVIIAETVARKGTGSSYEPAFDQPLRDGAEFQILTETPDWTFGHFESIGDGWVRNEFVAR